MEISKDWLKEISEKSNDLVRLKKEVNILIERYITLNGLRTIYNNIEKMGWVVKTYYFDEDDSKYVFFIELKSEENVPEEKRKIIAAGFEGIEDKFVKKHVKISTAKRKKNKYMYL